MKLGIIEAGGPPKPLDEQFGDYPAMFRRLLGGDAFAYQTYDVQAGHWPDRPEDCEAYLVTGSRAGVYDDLPWIAPLKAFLRAAKGRAALVGVCFGHQIMAEAFGGRVAKAPQGWGIGLHRYGVQRAESWMDPVSEVALPASHQDQVLEAPPNTRVLASSEFTPFGMLAYDDQPAFSIQLHPEFEPDFAAALVAARRGLLFPEAEADTAIESLSGEDDRPLLAEWIRRFVADASA